jgi:hypothetical protein
MFPGDQTGMNLPGSTIEHPFVSRVVHQADVVVRQKCHTPSVG